MKILFVILFLSGIYSIVNAQSADTELWTGPMIKYNISKKLRADFEQQFRWEENISKYSYTFSEFALKYKVFKYLDIKGVYRYYFIPNEGSGIPYRTEFDKSRLSFEVSTDTKLFTSDLKLGYRIRYQKTWETKSQVSDFFVESDLNDELFLRNKFDFSYNMSKLADPYVGWENFLRLDGINMIKKNRYTFGVKWKLTNDLSLDSFFDLDKEINTVMPKTKYIFGLGAVYSLSYSKKNQSIDTLSP